MIDNRMVGKKISALRQENALTQQQLAAMMNVSHQAVSKWESGQALPDIQTLMQLTRFFGITVEQLFSGEEIRSEADVQPEDDEFRTMNDAPQANAPEEDKEAAHMNIQQLLQMAPYMSREAVEEIVMAYEEGFSAAQIARIAPYVRAECVEELIRRHRPELSWDTLRRIAPFMRREAVDALARAIAHGKESVKPAGENINKAINDIGRAFDDIGREMGRAVKKAVRFGENVINEVSSAIGDLSAETAAETEAEARRERVRTLRRRTFERALQEENWDWIAKHISEMEDETELLDKITVCAREKGMQEWIEENLPACASRLDVQNALEDGNWDWIGREIANMESALQEQVALAAVSAEKWDWLIDHEGCMNLEGCAGEITHGLFRRGQAELAVQFAMEYLDGEQLAVLAREALAEKDWKVLEGIAPCCEDSVCAELLLGLAQNGEWDRVVSIGCEITPETAERLTEIALEQGNFDAVDSMEAYL